MSRSRRQSPYMGWTTSDSEKRFKRGERKAFRRQERICIVGDREMPDPKSYGNPRCGPKDGRRLIATSFYRWWMK